MRLLIVSDHPDLAEVPVSAFETPHTIAAVLVRGGDALTWLARNACDSAIVDLTLPDIVGAELIKQVRRRHPALWIIAVSGSASDLGDHLVDIEADILLPRTASLAVFKRAVGDAQRGRTVDSSTRRVLTGGKVAMIRAVASGYRAHEIAAWLGLSQNTVEEYLEQLKKHLGARTLAELVAAAVRLGIAEQILRELPRPPSREPAATGLRHNSFAAGRRGKGFKK